MVNADDLGAFGQGVSENGLETINPMESFKNWASMVIEGISVSPTNTDQQKKLNELLSTPIELGEDGINAIGSLIGLIEDDRLDDMLSNLAEKDTSMDARPVVLNWLKSHDMVNILEDATVDALAKDGMSIYEGLIGLIGGGVAGAALTKTPGGAISGAKIGSAIQDRLAQTEDSTDYDTKHDGAYDRGGADAWYHRPRNPHKIIDGKKVALTDPEEIKAYNSGYKNTEDTEGRTGGKQYEDLNEAKKAKAKAKVREAKMSPIQKAKREKIVKGMKKSKADFKDRYGKRGEEVMYATANKQAMKEEAEQQKALDNEVVKILTQIYNVIKEAAPSMDKEIAGHLFNANKNVVAAINAAKGSSNVDEDLIQEKNAYVMAAAAAAKAGKTEFEFPKGSGKMHKVTMDKDTAHNMLEHINKNIRFGRSNPMREIEIINEGKKINEAPVGIGTRLGTWARGKAAGAMGPLARGWQSQISGEKEVNAYANKLNLAFRKANQMIQQPLIYSTTGQKDQDFLQMILTWYQNLKLLKTQALI